MWRDGAEMIKLSNRTKEAFKTALAVVIVIAIAFYLGWEKPYWAAFAVLVTSLDTNGQSLNKGVMRILGTVVAVIAALTFFALFPQQRWAMLAVLSLYVGFCSYMLAGNWRRYTFFVAGFVCVVILVDGASSSPEDIFQIAMARLEETAMGILVYTAIATLLWPRSSRGELEASAQRLFAAQVELYQASLAEMRGNGTSENLRPIRLKEIQYLGQLETNLEAALLDSYVVWEMRRQWRHYHRLSRMLLQTMGRWSETFVDCRHLDLPRLLPNLEAVTAELDRRTDEIEHMLHGEPPQRPLTSIKLEVALADVRTLSHMDRAAVVAFKSQLDRLEELTRALFLCVQDIKGFGAPASAVVPAPAHHNGIALDPDRLHASVTVVASMCIGYCIWIFVDPPMHSTFFFQTTLWAMVSVLARQSATAIVPGILIACLVSTLAYVFIMPHLSGYAELGAMLFIIVFALYWLLSDPKLLGSRTGALCMFMVLISLDNNQSYDFAQLLNSMAGVLMALGVVILVQYFPFSPRPEKVFLRLLGRFFRQLEFLLTRLSVDWERERGPVGLWRTLLYRSDILRIPVRLAALAPQIDYRVLPGTPPEEVRDLAASLQAIAFRINELLDTRKTEGTNPLFLELLNDLRAWRLAVREVVRHWAEDPGALPPGDLQQRLSARLEALEKRIGEARDRFDPAALSQAQYEGLYRIVGALRALSEAGALYADIASRIDWRPWKEARF